VTVTGTGSSEPGGSALTYLWDLDNDNLYDDATGITVAVVFSDNGTFSIGLKVTNTLGKSGTDTASVVVANVAPVVNAGPDATINQGAAFSSSGSFTDAGSDTWTATVDYGDGSGIQPLTLTASKTFALSHTYNSIGAFNAAVCVTDNNGGAGCDTAVVTVLDVTPPFTSGHDPLPGATNVPVYTNIVVHVKDLAAGVNLSSLKMTVEGTVVSPAITGSAADYTLTYDPAVNFANSQVVDVTVEAGGLAGNVMAPFVYSFTIVPPPVATVGTEVLAVPPATALCNFNNCNVKVVASGSSVYVKATITSSDPSATPTGSVSIAYFTGTSSCNVRPASMQTVALSGGSGVTTAQSSNYGPLAVGTYSFKVQYIPNAAATALGFVGAPGECAGLLVQ